MMRINPYFQFESDRNVRKRMQALKMEVGGGLLRFSCKAGDEFPAQISQVKDGRFLLLRDF